MSILFICDNCNWGGWGEVGHNSVPGYRGRLDVRKFSFIQWVVAVWNSLTENVVSSPNVNIFKNRLDKLYGKMNQCVFT